MEYRSLFETARGLSDSLRNWRRDFHRHPELGFQEHRTAGVVNDHLQALGLESRTGVAETGVVALIEGAPTGPTVMMRFDMDALPIQEETGADYASTIPGVMHACGHDGHTAIGMAVAQILAAERGSLPGTVKLVFQPAEEGLGGALRMVEEGVLKDPQADIVLGLHLWNDKPRGWIGVTDGPAMAASATFQIDIHGQGGHGASPHQTVDPVFTAAQVISALQGIVSRNVDPLKAAVVSVTWVEAGDAYNVIPTTALLRGTIRSYEPAVRELVLQRVEQTATGIAEALGCTARIIFKELTPAVRNDLQVAERIRQLAQTLIPEAEISNSERTMGSEDMAFLMEEVPACYVFIGSRDDSRGFNAPHHNPAFDFDEDALAIGAGLLASAAWSFLDNPSLS